MIDAGTIIAQPGLLNAEIARKIAGRVLDVVTEADDALLRKGLVDRPGQDAHRVGVVQQHRVGAELAHVGDEIEHEGDGAQAAEDAADADRIGDGLLQPVFPGYVEIEQRRFVHADLDHIDDEVAALQRAATVEMFLDDCIGAELLRRPARHHAAGLEPLGIDVVQRDHHAPELGEIQDVCQQVLDEDGAARAHHGDLDHGIVLLETSKRVGPRSCASGYLRPEPEMPWTK